MGLERAGFGHEALVEVDSWSRKTLIANRPNWNVIDGPQSDLTKFDGAPYRGVDLVAGGVPCPPFSRAGKQLGASDERDLFPEALRVIEQVRPKAVMLENVRGFLDGVFTDYRLQLRERLNRLGYTFVDWQLLQAADYGVPQLRPRVVIVAIHSRYAGQFSWPTRHERPASSVGETLRDMMSSKGWSQVDSWIGKANSIAPTIVGGSKKHGGPDLGPTRARKAWAQLGVDGSTIANEPPEKDFLGNPKLTVQMVARLQGFPDEWRFQGGKTAAYRQVGNAFPPPVAHAVAQRIVEAISTRTLYAVA